MIRLKVTVADLVKGMENHGVNTRRFWDAYTRIALKGETPSIVATTLAEELLRKHNQAVSMVYQIASRYTDQTLESGSSSLSRQPTKKP